MDIRVEKTRTSITNAFLELRAVKPLEKITIKELCEKARINKSTFYSHYADIYDLSESLENHVIQNVMDNLIHPEYLFTKPKLFTQELFIGYISQDSLLRILFSGNRSNRLPEKIRAALRHTLAECYPNHIGDSSAEIFLDYAVYGGYYAFMKNRSYGDAQAIELIGKISELCILLFDRKSS